MGFWKLNLRIGVLENYLKIEIMKIGILKNYMRMWFHKNLIWKLEFWKINLKEIGISKIIWELKFWKLNLRIEVLEIKFERNQSFEN